MGYPVIAAGRSWFDSKKANQAEITEIIICDAYTPTGGEAASWDAADYEDDGVTCYLAGTTIIISGDGSGGIDANSNSNRMFAGFAALQTISGLEALNTRTALTMAGMFSGCTALRSIGGTDAWDLRNVTTMATMFNNCTALESVEGIENWNVGSVTSMRAMFQSCEHLGFDLSLWDVSQVTDMSFMFWGATGFKHTLKTVRDWNVGKVQSLDHFAAHAHPYDMDMSHWDTSSCENMGCCFYGFMNEVLDVTGIDTSKNRVFSQMFENSPNLKRIIGLEGFDTSQGVAFDEMFGRCPKLEELDLSSFDLTHARSGDVISGNGHKGLSFYGMLTQSTRLKKIILGPKFSRKGDGTETNSGRWFRLPTPDASLIDGADGSWYDLSGAVVDPAELPDGAGVYFASVDALRDEAVTVKNSTLLDIAAAIREKTGSTEKLKPSEMAAAIEGI